MEKKKEAFEKFEEKYDVKEYFQNNSFNHVAQACLYFKEDFNQDIQELKEFLDFKYDIHIYEYEIVFKLVNKYNAGKKRDSSKN